MSGIRRLHWGSVGPRTWGNDGQLFALWPEPVNADECFTAAGFTAFDDPGEEWDDDYERLVTGLVAALGEYGSASVHGGPRPVAPPLWDRIRGHRPEPMTPLQQLLWAEHDDNSPCRLEFGSPARAFVQIADGHEIMWIWLEDPLAPMWAALVNRLAGESTLVMTKLEWKHLLPRELE